MLLGSTFSHLAVAGEKPNSVLNLISVVAGVQPSAVEASPLQAEFSNPPLSSRPFTWWHWINGNITKDGITRDLEWMKDFGLGGAIVFNVGMLPDELPRKVPFGTEPWWGMVDHAIAEADRLGLKLGFHNCDGWSHSGGPWMTPEQSMKKLVWTERFVQAGDRDIVLEQPETILDYYRDVAILALPVPDRSPLIRASRLSCNRPGFQPEVLLDHDTGTTLALRNVKANQLVHLDFHFDLPQEIAAVTLTAMGQRIKGFSLSFEVSEDGVTYRSIKTFHSQSRGQLGWKTQGDGSTLTFSFPQQRTRHFRVAFLTCGDFDLAEVTLYASERIDLWEIKAGHMQYTEHGGSPETYIPDPNRYQQDRSFGAVDRAAILDLGDKLRTDHRLDWTPEKGNWRILRIGYTTTGQTNGPSTVEGRGLEADKLDPAALETHYAGFMKKLRAREVNRQTSSLSYTEIDSWEAGVQNWTGKMEEVFQDLNGYDMTPYLPVLVGGYVVESYEVSERFLWDFRKTLAHLIRQGCFQHLADLAGSDGLTAFAEGSGRQQYLYDPINYQSAAPIPKGEFWVGRDGGANLTAASALPMRPRIDCKVAASVAHLYGRQLAASESFTGGTLAWEFGPYDNKMLGDQAFTMGVNWIVLHTSAHQPYSHLKPGFSLGGAGSHFHRNNIVYTASNAWPHYMARCQYLLRQGLFVADVLYFTGEDVPNYLGFRDELSVPLPEGYDYDGCNAEILLEQAQVERGDIVLKSGMTYRLLMLPDRPAMSLAMTRCIQELVQQGATVVGPPPQVAPGLRDYPRRDLEVREIATQVWGDCDGRGVKEHRYGQGRVIWGKSFAEIARDLDLSPDFDCQTGRDDAQVHYIHRRLGEADIYFVANALLRDETIRARFRVGDKVPQLYCPDTGEVMATAYYRQGEGSVEVPLHLDPAGSVFVVFTPGTSHRSVTDVTGGAMPRLTYAPGESMEGEFSASGDYRVTTSDGTHREVQVTCPADIHLDGLWDMRFPMAKGPEAKTLRSELFAWNESGDPEIRYFSGTATYSQSFELPVDRLAEGHRVYIDLGDVRKLARVRINGKPCPDLWKVPFRAEITDRVVAGTNRIEVEVTNTWTNRMIGDEQLPADVRYKRYLTALPDWLDGSVPRDSERQTFTIQRFYDKNDRLIPSGLLGPVTIQTTTTKVIH